MNDEQQSQWIDNINIDEIFSHIWNFALSALPSLFIFGFIFFVASIFLLLLCKRYGIFKRQNKYWNIAVKVNYLYIPCVFICCGMACGLLSHTQSYIEERHKEIIDPVSNFAVDTMTLFFTNESAMKRMEGKRIQLSDLMKEIFGDYYYTPKTDSFMERQKAYIVNQVLFRAGRFVLSLAVRKGLTELCLRAHVGATIQENVVEFGVGFVEKLEAPNTDLNISSIITAAVHSKVQSLLSSLYIHFFIYLLIFLAIPFIEVGIYFYLMRVRKAKSDSARYEKAT